MSGSISSAQLLRFRVHWVIMHFDKYLNRPERFMENLNHPSVHNGQVRCVAHLEAYLKMHDFRSSNGHIPSWMGHHLTACLLTFLCDKQKITFSNAFLVNYHQRHRKSWAFVCIFVFSFFGRRFILSLPLNHKNKINIERSPNRLTHKGGIEMHSTITAKYNGVLKIEISNSIFVRRLHIRVSKTPNPINYKSLPMRCDAPNTEMKKKKNEIDKVSHFRNRFDW